MNFTVNYAQTIHVCQKNCLLTFGSVNYASTAGGYAAVTKGLMFVDIGIC